MLVSPLPYLVGYKADGDLGYVTAGRGAHRRTSSRSTRRAKKAAVPGLTLALHRAQVRLGADQAGQRHLQVRVAQAETVLRGKAASRFPRSGIALALATDNARRLRARGARRAGAWSSTASSTAWPAQGNVTRSLERNAELQLTLDKTDYAPRRGDRGAASRRPTSAPASSPSSATRSTRRQWFKTDYHRLGAEDPRAEGLRGQRLRERAVRARPGLRRDLHEPAVLRRGAVLGQPATRRTQRRSRSTAPELVQPGRGAAHEGARRPARRAWWCSRSTRASCRWRATSTPDPLALLLPEARARGAHLADPRPDPARVQAPDGSCAAPGGDGEGGARQAT